MIKAVFCADGRATTVSDFDALNFVDRVTATYCRGYGRPMIIYFSNECVLDAFVLRLMEGGIPEDRIEFYYQAPGMESEVELKFDNELGIIAPDGVQNVGVRNQMTEQILKLGYANMKARKLAEKDRKDDQT